MDATTPEMPRIAVRDWHSPRFDAEAIAALPGPELDVAVARARGWLVELRSAVMPVRHPDGWCSHELREVWHYVRPEDGVARGLWWPYLAPGYPQGYPRDEEEAWYALRELPGVLPRPSADLGAAMDLAGEPGDRFELCRTGGVWYARFGNYPSGHGEAKTAPVAIAQAYLAWRQGVERVGPWARAGRGLG